MPDMKKAALAYAKRGWPIFPCNSIKEPYTKNGVLDATTNPEKIEEWWGRWPRAGIGLDVAGAGFMVLDHDVYKSGYSRADLEQAVGRLPPTKLRARSPRGGEHEYFALNPGEVVSPSASKLAPHVDVRSFHSYVLLPPSRTGDGEYSWVDEGKAAYRTDEMVRLANAHREKHEDRDNWLIEPDLEENIALAAKWLREDAKIAVEGLNGDSMAYATAAHMKSFGLSEAMAFDLMWEYWNPRCSPPWDGDDIEHLERKVENGYRYNTSPPGNITPAYKVAKSQAMFKPVERKMDNGGREVRSGKFRFVNRAGMDEIRPPEWLIKDFLPDGGYGLLVGAPGTFKSFVALDIALSVATGASFPWAGMWGTIGSTGKVLFTLGEGRSEFTKRVRAWEQIHWKGTRLDTDACILADPMPLVSAGPEEWDTFIDGALDASPEGYKLIVLDTVGRAMQGLDENSQQSASSFSQMVERVQRELGGTVLALHHTGYGNETRGRGSSVFLADPDTVVVLNREDKQDFVTMTMRKQKDAAEWAAPKGVRLDEVQLPDGLKSLVAMKPAEHEVAKIGGAKAAAKQLEDIKEKLSLQLLDKVVIDLLKENPTRAWSQNELASAVAMDTRVGVGSARVRQLLTSLREDKTTHAHHCFDAKAPSHKAGWRYQNKA